MRPAPAGDVHPEPASYRFDDVHVDAHACTVTRAGVPQPLEPKAYAVLLELLRHANELVTRDALLDAVWGHRHVTPGVLTRAIAQIRHALDDDPHVPRYIRTRHALGYCFIGRLEDDTVPTPAAPRSVSANAAPSHASSSLPLQSSLPDATDLPPAPSTVAEAAAPAPPVARPASSRAPARRRLWPGLAVLLAALAALALWQRARPPPLPAVASPSVAVLPFADARGGDDYFARGVAAELHDALAGVRGVIAVSVARLARDEQDAQAIGRRLGTATVLDGEVRRDGDRIVLSAWLVDTRTGQTRWSGRFERDADAIFDVEASVAGEVVQALTGRAPDAGLAQRLAPTRSLVAYDAYLRGLQSLDRAEGEAGYRRAVAAFEDALRADPHFARAQAGLCRAGIARFEDDMDADAYARADAACRRAAAMAPELREVDLAAGDLERARGRPADAVPRLERAAGDPALRPAAYAALARVYAGLGRTDLSRSYFDRALRLQPNDAGLHRERGYAAYLAGDLDGAIAAFRTATALAPGDERLWSGLGGLYLVAGRRPQAAQAFERSLALRPNYAALSNYGSLLYETRDYARAATLYRQALAVDPRDFRLWGNLGDALAATRAPTADVASAYRDAATRAARYTAIRADDAQAWALLAWYRANLRLPADARAALGRAESLGSEPAEVAFLGAQALALLGDTDAARARLDRARAGGVGADRILASPVLRPLATPSPLPRQESPS